MMEKNEKKTCKEKCKIWKEKIQSFFKHLFRNRAKEKELKRKEDIENRNRFLFLVTIPVVFFVIISTILRKIYEFIHLIPNPTTISFITLILFSYVVMKVFQLIQKEQSLKEEEKKEDELYEKKN